MLAAVAVFFVDHLVPVVPAFFLTVFLDSLAIVFFPSALSRDHQFRVSIVLIRFRHQHVVGNLRGALCGIPSYDHEGRSLRSEQAEQSNQPELVGLAKPKICNCSRFDTLDCLRSVVRRPYCSPRQLAVRVCFASH